MNQITPDPELITNQTTIGNITSAAGIAVGMGATAVHIDAVGDVGDVVTGTKVTLVNEAPKERVASRFQISPPPDDYFSRPDPEDKLAALLTAGYDGFRTVFLHGSPGTGRSWLARQVASRPDVAAAFPDGILFADLGTTDIRTAVWNFIEPYTRVSQASLSNPTQFTAEMEKALGDQSVLIVIDGLEQWRSNWQELRNWLPYTCENCLVLLLVPRLPETLERNRELEFPIDGLTPEEAMRFLDERLVRNSDGSAKCNPETIGALAEAMAYTPKAMADAVQNINLRRIKPEEYLAALRSGEMGGGGVSILNPELEEIYRDLPKEGRALLPFLCVLEPWSWTADDLMGVSLRTSREVEIGLAQLEWDHLVDSQRDSRGKVRFKTPAIIKDFSQHKLEELQGKQLYKASMALRASNALRTAELVLGYARQSLLTRAWADAQADATDNPVTISSAGQGENNSAGTIGKSVTAGTMAVPLDLLEAFFEDVILDEDKPYLGSWLALMAEVEFELVRKQLEAIFDWAVEQEDWLLVQRFANRLGINTSFVIGGKMDSEANYRSWGPLEFTFALIKKVTIRNTKVRDLIFKGSLIKDTEWINCEFVACAWPGTNVIRSRFTGVDMVGFSLPGGVITDCKFKDVDYRFADFRGTIFQQCNFANVSFVSARLENAKFIDCIFDLETVDFLRTAWEENFEAIRKEQRKKLEVENNQSE